MGKTWMKVQREFHAHVAGDAGVVGAVPELEILARFEVDLELPVGADVGILAAVGLETDHRWPSGVSFFAMWARGSWVSRPSRSEKVCWPEHLAQFALVGGCGGPEIVDRVAHRVRAVEV